MAEIWVDEVDDLEVTTFLPTVMPTIVAEMISAAELHSCSFKAYVQGGSNMTGTDLCVNKPHCAAAVRP